MRARVRFWEARSSTSSKEKLDAPRTLAAPAGDPLIFGWFAAQDADRNRRRGDPFVDRRIGYPARSDATTTNDSCGNVSLSLASIVESRRSATSSAISMMMRSRPAPSWPLISAAIGVAVS